MTENIVGGWSEPGSPDVTDLRDASTVHVVMGTTDRADCFVPLLDPEEKAHAETYAAPSSRSAFVTARGMVRTLLGRALDCLPSDVVLVRRCAGCGATTHGKPYAAAARAPYFSIAHSEGYVAVALALAGPVGLDLEVIRELPELPGMADLVLGPDERAQFARVGSAARLVWFHQRWCLKEACGKRSGQGLGEDLRALRVSGDGSVFLLPARSLPPDTVGALAVPDGIRTVRLSRWRAALRPVTDG